MTSEQTQDSPSTATASPPTAEAFAHKVAHDLRNVLNNFNLNLQYLEMTLDLNDPKTARAIERMREEVAKFRRMVEEIPQKARDGWE